MSSYSMNHPKHRRRRGLTRNRIELGLKGKTISGVTSSAGDHSHYIHIGFTDDTHLMIMSMADRGPSQLFFSDGEKEWIDD